MVDDMCAGEPCSGASTDLAKFEAVPFTEGFISQFGWIFTGRSWTIIPQPAASLVRTDAELGFFGEVPDLNLRISLQVDPAVGQSNRLVVDKEFIVREFFIGRQVRTVAIVY